MPDYRFEVVSGHLINVYPIGAENDEDNYKFLRDTARQEKVDLSRAVRELVSKGRLMEAIEEYKKSRASLGRAAEIAGLSVGEMMAILREYGVESRIEKDDYLEGLENLRKVW